MKIYVASSFSLIDKVEAVVKELESVGHEITIKWWARAFNIPSEGLVHTIELKKRYANLKPQDFYARPECKWSYETDFIGVKDADILVLVVDDIPRAYNGANIELGIALSDNKRCYSIGNLENSALYYPVIKCKSIIELLEAIKNDRV